MPQEDSCCRVCSRGLYSCHWRKPSKKKRRHACCWFSVVALASLLSLCWMYICVVTFNDREDVNWKAFTTLKRWVNWFTVLLVISAVVTSYCVLLLLFALFQVALGEKLLLHWLHKIFLFLGLVFFAFGVAGLLKWKEEWPTLLLSLQATGPFLQFGAVGALTLLSPFVFRGFRRAKTGSKAAIGAAFVLVSGILFLCPLFIKSPCLMEASEIPDKPRLIGHRGAPMLAPENTMMSFNSSIACDVAAFETDVQLSKDRVPFLMHDHHSEFLSRTTDVREKFPDKLFSSSSNVTWEELQTLNAGDWFLKTDPFHSVAQLSEEEATAAGNQTIPSLRQLLELAQQHNISVMFDLYSSNQENDTIDTVRTILQSGIDPRLILWLPPAARAAVTSTDPGFIHVYNNESDMTEEGGNHLNVKYSNLSTDKIRALRMRNVSVNLWVVNEPWLFSLLWCAGASSVTTNSCHLLKKMSRPDWTMAHRTYTAVWISVDVLCCLVMAGLFVCQRTARGVCHRRATHGNNTCAWNEKELSPFLPTG